MEYIIFVQSFSGAFLDSFFQLVTVMGEEYFIFAAVALFLWCIDREFGYRLGFAYASNVVLNLALKETFQVPRPEGEGIRHLRTETASGYSFPSGHTQNAASFWTSVMVRFKKWWLYGVGILMILLVGLSRVYLGAHTPADVVGGMVIGSGWVFVVNGLFGYAERTGKRAILLILVIPALAGLILFPTEDYSKAAGAFTGFFAGYLVESKYIRHGVGASTGARALKYAAGMAVLLAIKMSVGHILPDLPPAHFFRYFLMAIWVSAIAPYLFKTISYKCGTIN
ncbi:MAG: phosphatase PAP2 family protein [Peptococcaceae bacterium]|nr:phosphatase PAP2 family protein [Peptococcaceae bacterium]